MKIHGLLVLILLTVPPAALASTAEADLWDGNFSGRIALASDCVFRGESETEDGDIPALQGDITWTHSSNLYAGDFASGNNFYSAPEVDAVVAPYVGKFGDSALRGINYNVFVYHYMYPDVRELDYTELWLHVSKDINNTNIGIEVTPTLNDQLWVLGVSKGF